MTTYSAEEAAATLAGLLKTPIAVPLEEPLSVGSIIAMAEEVSRARAERDEAQARLQAICATCWPLHRNPGHLGDFARTILAEADPNPERAA